MTIENSTVKTIWELSGFSIDEIMSTLETLRGCLKVQENGFFAHRAYYGPSVVSSDWFINRIYKTDETYYDKPEITVDCTETVTEIETYLDGFGEIDEREKKTVYHWTFPLSELFDQIFS